MGVLGRYDLLPENATDSPRRCIDRDSGEIEIAQLLSVDVHGPP